MWLVTKLIPTIFLFLYFYCVLLVSILFSQFCTTLTNLTLLSSFENVFFTCVIRHRPFKGSVPRPALVLVLENVVESEIEACGAFDTKVEKHSQKMIIEGHKLELSESPQLLILMCKY